MATGCAGLAGMSATGGKAYRSLTQRNRRDQRKRHQAARQHSSVRQHHRPCCLTLSNC